MNLKAALVIPLVCAVACLCTPPVTAEAASHTLRLQVTHVAVATTILPVGDESGHILGVARREGTATLSNGETAAYYNVGTFDIRRGKGGDCEGYTKLTFADGSTIVLAWTTPAPADSPNSSPTPGQGTIIAGSGRFAGIEGTAAFTGKETKPGAISAEATITYTLP